MNQQPDVSIAMMTYFHEKYVSRAIESVLEQRTKYTYEIIVADDCSMDETRNILKSYQDKYPSIIKTVFNEKNLGISKNNYNVRTHCSGRYIATLSGDDYWIDSEKIEKQVEFLDSHPEYYGCVTAIQDRFDDEDIAYSSTPAKKYRNCEIDLEMYLHGAQVGTHGLMMRNAYLSPEGREYFSTVYKASPYIDDATECLLILNKGPLFSMADESVVYRNQRIKSDKHNYNSMNTAIMHVSRIVDLYNYIEGKFKEKFDLFYLYKHDIAIGLAFSISVLKFKEFISIYKRVPFRYRKRMLIIRAIPTAIKLSIEALQRRIKRGRGLKHD